MKIAERHKFILDKLNQQGVVSVARLSEEMEVTMVTVRKDLKVLEKKGLLHRSHGSAAHVSTYVNDLPYRPEQRECLAEKSKIATLAVQQIEENDAVIIGSGTTLSALVHALPKNIRLTVLTAAIHVTMSLIDYPNIEIVQLGGVVHKGSSSVVGHYSEDMLANFSCNKLFLSVKGISPDTGLMASDTMEAHLYSIMINSVPETIVLADSSKFGRMGFEKICSIEEVHTVITDDGLSDLYRKELERRGLEVLIA